MVAEAGDPAPVTSVLLGGAVTATCVVAACAAGAGAHWANLAPIAVPAVLVGPALPWRAAARLGGFAVIAAVLVGAVRVVGTDAPPSARLAWHVGHPVLLAAISVAAAAVRDRYRTRGRSEPGGGRRR